MRIRLFSLLHLPQRWALFPAFLAGSGLLWFAPLRPSIETQVLVINGGAGGTAAGIQSARMGVSTLVVEPTAWLGGMLTAAGVSATDGNHRMPAGIWGEFREQIRDYYGGAEAVATGWVSNTHFEPHVGAAIFRQMAEREPRLTVWFHSRLLSLKATADGWEARIRKEGKTVRVTARVLVDGTDLGDVAAMAGVGYDLGMDSRMTSGEPMAPEKANGIIQDLTLVAILKDFGPGADKTIPKPPGYNPEAFRCSCQDLCPEEPGLHPCEMTLTYAKLPGGKIMLNWPRRGNDFYANVVETSGKEREVAFDSARMHTLRYIYFLQNELGYRNLGIADDEFPTPDGLAFYPYHREGRRIHGLVRVRVGYISNPYEGTLYRTGGIVGDYPIDHHHAKNPEAPEIEFPKVPSFNIPLGALIPKDADRLVMADKAISVSNIVNGSSRLQPVVLQIGQAAGVVAALSVLEKESIKNLSVRSIQNRLLQSGAYLMPFFDVEPTDAHFEAIQRIGATGILRGQGEPYLWANRTWFYPDTTLAWNAFREGLASLPDDAVATPFVRETGLVSLEQGLEVVSRLTGNALDSVRAQAIEQWPGWGFSRFDPQRPATRKELAVLLDYFADPFNRWEVDWEGNWMP